MASPIQNFKIVGKTAGDTLTTPLGAGLVNVSIANAFRKVGQFFESIGIGSRSANCTFYANGVLATGTITFSSIAAADTVTINGTVFTGTNGTPTGNQFKTGTTDTLSAASLASAINASGTAVVVNNLSATSALAVVTVTAKGEGTLGNLMTLAISAHGSVSAANLSGGTDGTVTALAKGI